MNCLCHVGRVGCDEWFMEGWDPVFGGAQRASSLTVPVFRMGRGRCGKDTLNVTLLSFIWVTMGSKSPKPFASLLSALFLQACEDPSFQRHGCESEERKWQGQVGGGVTLRAGTLALCY